MTTIMCLLLLSMLAMSCNDTGDGSTSADSGSSNSMASSSSTDSKAMDTPPVPEIAQTEMDDTPDVMPTPGMPGTMAANFTLMDMSGNEHVLSNYLAEGKTVVLEWFNPGCSVVHYYYDESTSMVDTYNSLKNEMGDNVVWLAVISQDPSGRGGSDEEVNASITNWNIPYPVLRDGSGVVGKSYGAEATPAMYVISPDGMIAYNGSVDEFQKGGDMPPVGMNYVVEAVNAVSNGQEVAEPKREAIG